VQVFKREPPFPKESSSSSEEYEVTSLFQSAVFALFESDAVSLGLNFDPP
jgi:hypothetical protein